MATLEWNDEWGTKEENEILEGVDSLEGYKVGEEVRLNQDSDDGVWSEGEEALIIGVTEVGSAKFGNLRRELVVVFEGCDPTTLSPFIIDAVDDLDFE